MSASCRVAMISPILGRFRQDLPAPEPLATQQAVTLRIERMVVDLDRGITISIWVPNVTRELVDQSLTGFMDPELILDEEVGSQANTFKHAVIRNTHPPPRLRPSRFL